MSDRPYDWSRFKGYNVSTKGDKRFSAFVARMPDGRSIEMHYQCDVKGFDPGGRNWRLGKGKLPLNPLTDVRQEYLNLWEAWAFNHPTLINELKRLADNHNRVLCDPFAFTHVNQAWALATILNKKGLHL